MESFTTSITENNLDKHIELILRQTDYTKETAIKKLQLHNNDHLSVIKEYMGVPSST